MTTRGETLHSVRGQAIRRRQIAYRLLDRLDSLSFVPSLNWLRALRVVLVLAAVGAYFTIGKTEALLISMAFAPVEIAIVGRSVVEVLKGDRE